MGFLEALPKVRCWFGHASSSSLHQLGAIRDAELLVHPLAPALWHGGAATRLLLEHHQLRSFAQAVSNGSQSKPMPSIRFVD